MTDDKEFPPGDYAIVELFGHTTLVGRIAEVERFGAKMLVIEPIFAGEMMGPVYHGGAAIYRLTPCSAEIAYARAPTQGYQLPPSIRAVFADPALPPPEPLHDIAHTDDGFNDDFEDDDL